LKEKVTFFYGDPIGQIRGEVKMLVPTSRILLVDDYEIVRTMLRRSLEELGYMNLEEAGDGQEAFEKIKKSVVDKNPYVLVFTDWNMPRISGAELVEKCKKDPTLQAVEFIMVTSESEQERVLQAIGAGAIDYFVKPFSREVVTTKIERLRKHFKKKSK
jgi:two-component system chemotaxis response regulator CheY